MTRKTSFAKLFVPYIVVAGLTAAAVSYGQEGPRKELGRSTAPRVVPPPADSGKTSANLTPPVRLPTPMETLTARVDELEKQNAALRADLTAVQADLKKFHEDVAAAIKPPPGYTTMLITKSNFNNVESNALMKFYVRP